METGGRPRKKNKPEDGVLLEQYRTMTAQEVADIYGVSRDTVRNWVYAARKRRALAAGEEMSPDQVADLQRLRAHLEQLRAELDLLAFPDEIRTDSLLGNETPETAAKSQYLESLQQLSPDIRRLRDAAADAVRGITEVLNSIGSLENAKEWNNIPDAIR